MKQTNGYIVAYALVLTILCGSLLAFTSQGLKERQKKNEEIDKKKKILGAVMQLKETDDIEKLYAEKVTSYVVDSKGVKIDGIDAFTVDVRKEYKLKKDIATRNLPVFEVKTDAGVCYVLPVFGAGLWDDIWGFVALESDKNTIRGALFDHKGETPGLGARIATKEIQQRFTGKKIFEGATLVSVEMVKGETGGGEKSIKNFENRPHQVDGMSGATITGVGLNDMLKNYLEAYKAFLQSKDKVASL